MSDRLYRVLLERENELVSEIHRRLRTSGSSHYAETPWGVLLHRVESLTAYFLIAVRETPDRFADYVADAATERIGEGFRLAEALAALRALEDEVARIVVEDVALPGRTPALARITTIVGEAKNRLVKAYMEGTEHGIEDDVEAVAP